jgi:predicted RNase H-like nuclease (RuvC/YqgF family)
MTENKKRINAFIPGDLYSKVMQRGYSTITEAIIKGFEKLLEAPEPKIKSDNISSSNEGLLMSLQVRVEELQAHNDTLKKELENYKTLHNNYMLQVQTILNQKIIEAPGAKKPWWRFW